MDSSFMLFKRGRLTEALARLLKVWKLNKLLESSVFSLLAAADKQKWN